MASASASVGSSRLEDQLGHLLLEEEGFAEIAAQDVAEPDEELGEDRLVEAEPVADLGDLLGVGVVAGDDRGGVAGREPQHQEHQHRDDQHHRDGGGEAAQDIGEHGSVRRARAAAGMSAAPIVPATDVDVPEHGRRRGSMPVTFLRQRDRLIPLPELDVGADTATARTCTASAIAFCLAGSVSRANASRSFSISASHGQPNIALSQPALRKPADDRIDDVDRRPGGEEGVPAAGVRRVLLGAARDQRLPVHRLHVDLEAGLLQQRLRDRREVGERRRCRSTA